MPPETILLAAAGRRQVVTVADTPVDWAIDSAPGLTLTVPDPARALTFSPGTLGDASTTLYAGLWGKQWAVTEVGREDRAVTLTLEHPGVFGLRSLHGPIDASDDIARPQFADLLWRRSRAGKQGDPLYTPLTDPEASGKKPPVLSSLDSSSQKTRDAQLAPGFQAGVSFKIAGEDADDEQMKLLTVALSVADDLKAPRKARMALVEALIVESRCRNLTTGDGTSTGALQVTADTARRNNLNARDVEQVCRFFLEKGFARNFPVGAIPKARQSPRMQAGEIAQWCQGSRYPTRYQTAQPEAQAVLAAWSGSGSTDLTAAREGTDAFSLGKDEDGWTKFTALATDSQRRAYATLYALYWVTDNQVAQSRPLLAISRYAPGVKALTWKADANRQVDTVNCELVCSDLVAWQLAGHTVVVFNEGDANGTYIVSKWSRQSRKDRHATFELTRLRPYLPESAIAQANTAATTGATTSVAAKSSEPTITTRGGAKGIVDQAFEVAKAAGGSSIYVGSSYRPGSVTTTGNVSDHSQNNATQAARDIGKQGVDLLAGPPSAELDRATAAVCKAFGVSWKPGTTLIKTFTWKSYRVQLIYRTPLYGGHMGHLHCGARQL